MVPEDKIVLNALKFAEKAAVSGTDREKAKGQVEKATATLTDPMRRAAFGRISDYFLARERMKQIGQPLTPPLSDILALGQASLVQSAEFAWQHAGDAVLEFPLPELLSIAPSIRVLDVVARKNRDFAAHACALVLERPEVAEVSAVFDWLAQRARPKDLAKLAPQLLSGHPRRRHLKPRDEVLRAALLRDKTGDLIRACFAIAKDHPPAFERLRLAISTTPNLLIQFIASLPKTVAGANGEVAVQLLESWLPSFPKTAPSSRENLSGVLAALAGSLLRLPKRKDIQIRTLDTLARSAFPWLLAMEDAKDASDFWLVARAEDLAQARKPKGNISHYGAGLLASSIEKAKSGLAAEVLLEALALNLGMAQISNIGEIVSFDSSVHEDTVGGLLKGDKAAIVESGWTLGDQMVRRAKVSPSPYA